MGCQIIEPRYRRDSPKRTTATHREETPCSLFLTNARRRNPH